MKESLVEELNKFFGNNFPSVKVEVGRGNKRFSIKFSWKGLQTVVRLNDKDSFMTATWELKFDRIGRVFTLPTKDFITIATTYMEFLHHCYKPDMGPCLELFCVSNKTGIQEYHVMKRAVKYDGRFSIVTKNLDIVKDAKKGPNLAYLIYIPLILTRLFPKFRSRYVFSLDGTRGRIGPYLWRANDYWDETGYNYQFKIKFPSTENIASDNPLFADIHYTKSGNFIIGYKSTSSTKLCAGDMVTGKAKTSVYYVISEKDEYGSYLTIKKELKKSPGVIVDNIPLLEYKNVIISKEALDKGYFYIPVIS